MNDAEVIVVAFTVAGAFMFIANVVFFFANLKLYTEILKAEDQRRRKEGPK